MSVVKKSISKKKIPKKAAAKKSIKKSAAISKGKISKRVAARISNVSSSDWLYVMPRKDKWVVRKDGSERVSGIYPTKIEAVNAAKKTMKLTHVNYIIVHDALGNIIALIKE